MGVRESDLNKVRGKVTEKFHSVELTEVDMVYIHQVMMLFTTGLWAQLEEALEKYGDHWANYLPPDQAQALFCPLQAHGRIVDKLVDLGHLPIEVSELYGARRLEKGIARPKAILQAQESIPEQVELKDCFGPISEMVYDITRQAYEYLQEVGTFPTFAYMPQAMYDKCVHDGKQLVGIWDEMGEIQVRPSDKTEDVIVSVSEGIY